MLGASSGYVDDKLEKIYYTFDHANKLREGRRDFVRTASG